ncbi:MAG: hypothetical protein MH132_09560 [Hydrotalea sp.]|jgi:cell division protein FtsL|nr:hypothetical protein [Hydrotalea sp.]
MQQNFNQNNTNENQVANVQIGRNARLEKVLTTVGVVYGFVLTTALVYVIQLG